VFCFCGSRSDVFSVEKTTRQGREIFAVSTAKIFLTT